jgi:hypothetical protein
MRPLSAAVAVTLMLASGTVAGQAPPVPILGCWAGADRGDDAEMKLHFMASGALVQYDENQETRRKRTFGAWEMEAKGTYLRIYWPTGGITSYGVKRIGPILHFTGLHGVRNFTMREIDARHCWEPR